MPALAGLLVGLVAGVSLEAEIRVAAWPEDEALSGALAAEDIEAWIEGRPVEATGVRGPGDPLIVLLVMDLVGDLNRSDRARETLRARIEAMGPEWHVALLAAPDGLRVVVDPTLDRGRVTEQLMELPVTGVPGLLDGVEPAARIADRMLAGADVRVAVVFVTDGAISQYRGDYTTRVVNPSDRSDLSRRFGESVIQEKMAALGDAVSELTAPLFFVHLEERSNDSDVAYQTGIRHLARLTGGDAVFVRGVADVPDAIERTLDRVGASYSVTVEPPRGIKGTARIRLEAAGGTRLAHRATLSFVKQSQKVKKR